MSTRKHRALAAASLSAALLSLAPCAAQADDVGFGIGLSYVAGSGLAVGVKAFSNDEDNELAGSVGLDYVIDSGSFRPNVGAAYQGEGYFGDGNIGYNLGTHSVDFGVGGGWSDSDDDHKPVLRPHVT